MSEELDFKIDWATKSELRGPGERSIGTLIRALRDRLSPNAQGVSVTYLDDKAMRKLNREHRGINRPTDVLSFPSFPEPGAFQHLGDLVISLTTADRQAAKLGVSRRREVETLVIHGFLHLCGYDHETDQGEMLSLQATLERELLETEPLPMVLPRGRKPGSKVKVLKDGSRVVVTGRAARALDRQSTSAKVKPAPAKGPVPEQSVKRKRATASDSSAKGAGAPSGVRAARKRRASPRPRGGVID